MRNVYLILGLMVALACSCQKKQEKKQEAVDTPAQPTVRSVPEADTDDTIYKTQSLLTEDYFYPKETYTKKLGDDVYRISSESYSLNDSSITEIDLESPQGKPYKVVVNKYHNTVYKTKVIKNRSVLFTKTWTKKDFLKFENQPNGFVKDSAPHAPKFVGITSEGKVLFDMVFGIPNSDFGGIYFFTTDLKGNIQQLECYSSTGSGGCDGRLELSDNQKYFLTCNKLYGPNGYVFDFRKPDMVTTRLLSDTSFLALSDPRENGDDKIDKVRTTIPDTKSDNLIVYHVDGKKLASFRYDGFFGELDYYAPIEVLKEASLIVAYDDTKQNIRTISLSDPRKSQITSLKGITRYKKRDTASQYREMEFDTFLGKKYYLYFVSDTLKGYYMKQN